MISIGGPSPKEELVISDYKYKKITDDTSGTEAIIWTPASGKHIRLTAGIISVTAAGTVELKDNTSGATLAILSFGDKNAVPFSLGFEFSLPVDHALSGKYTADVGTADAHISIFGIEV